MTRACLIGDQNWWGKRILWEELSVLGLREELPRIQGRHHLFHAMDAAFKQQCQGQKFHMAQAEVPEENVPETQGPD